MANEREKEDAASGDARQPRRAAVPRLALALVIFLAVGLGEQLLVRSASAGLAAALTLLSSCLVGFVAYVVWAGAAVGEERRDAWLQRRRETFTRLREEATQSQSVTALGESVAATLGEFFEARATIWVAGDKEAPPLPLKLVESVEEPVLLPAAQRQGGVRSLLAATLARARIDALIVLRCHGRVVGMVVLRGERAWRLTPEQSEALEVLAVVAGTAIENARLQEELARSMVVVARANRLASLGLLTAGVAHEVRNPLAALRTFAQLLPERWDNAEFRREFGSVVLSEIDRIRLLMNDVLRFARRGPEPEEAASLTEIVASIVPLLKVQAGKKGVELVFDPEVEAPRVAAEIAAVRQVVMNLVLNAIEATPAGGCIRINCEGRADGGARRAVLRVSDSGPGIAPEHLPLIFEPFFTTRTEGTGLGLAITHQIVGEHGGTIEVQSAPAAGTTFRVELPASETSARRPADGPALRTSAARP